MTITSNIGMLSLSIGMVVWGIMLLVGTAMPTPITAIWAVITGILLLVGR